MKNYIIILLIVLLSCTSDKSNENLSYHVGRIKLTLTNEPGALHIATGIVASNLGNISNILIADRAEDFFDFRFDIQVRDVKHLTEIIAALRAEPMVHNVDRLRE